MKNKAKKGLIICTMAVIVSGALPAFAEITAYVTEKDGIKYEYDKEQLINSIILDTSQSERYYSENLYAIKDSIQGYIDIEDIFNAIMESDNTFNIDRYTESDSAKKIVISDLKKVDENGGTIAEHILKVIQVGVTPGMDKVSLLLVGVTNPEEYEVKFKNYQFVWNDGVFIGVVDSGTTIDQITITKKEDTFKVIDIK